MVASYLATTVLLIFLVALYLLRNWLGRQNDLTGIPSRWNRLGLGKWILRRRPDRVLFFVVGIHDGFSCVVQSVG
jgi:hypothetical protein